LYGDLALVNSWPTSESDVTSPPPTRAATLGYIPIHLMQPLNFTDNEVLSRLYSSFLTHHRDLTTQGLWSGDLHENPMDVALMLPNFNKDEHRNIDPVSIFIADFLSTFGQVRVPERLGIMHLLYRLIRVSGSVTVLIRMMYINHHFRLKWQINPTQESHSKIPMGMRPSPLQIVCPHPAWIEFVVW